MRQISRTSKKSLKKEIIEAVQNIDAEQIALVKQKTQERIEELKRANSRVSKMSKSKSSIGNLSR